MAPIDPADYQLSDAYLPDKGSTYPFPPEENLWIHSHKAIRGEIELIRNALEAVVARQDQSVPLWIVDSLQVGWDAHFQYLEAHLPPKETTVGTEAKRRFRWPEDASHTHEDLEKKLQAVDESLKALRNEASENPNQSYPAAQALLQAWIEYQEVVLPHMQYEEETLIPLVRAYMSHWDMTKLVFKIRKMVPKSELGAIVHFTGEEHMRYKNLPLQSIPDILWPFVFQPAVDDYRERILANIEAVLTGVELPHPHEKPGMLARFCGTVLKQLCFPSREKEA
jgi:hypothetical protein